MMRFRLPETLRPLLEKPTHPLHDRLNKNGLNLAPEKHGPSGLDTQESATTAMDLPFGFEKPRFI